MSIHKEREDIVITKEVQDAAGFLSRGVRRYVEAHGEMGPELTDLLEVTEYLSDMVVRLDYARLLAFAFAKSGVVSPWSERHLKVLRQPLPQRPKAISEAR